MGIVLKPDIGFYCKNKKIAHEHKIDERGKEICPFEKIDKNLLLDNEENIIAHKSLIKIILNPILRKLGWVIVSVVDIENKKFIKYQLRKYINNKII